jgi:predicted HicB family RNase H-like nuclease
MSEVEYRLGDDIADEEEFRDSHGRLVDEAYVQSAVEDAVSRIRGPGRPSLSWHGESPLLRVRISRELDEAVSRAAGSAGVTRSQWVRQVLDEAVHRTG